MTNFRRIAEVISAAAMIIFCICLLAIGDEAYPVILAFYCIALVVHGLRLLVYYYMLARFMVGGKIMLLGSILFMDLGATAASLVDVPFMYILVYLCGILAFSGIVDILRALEARQIDGSWMVRFSKGIVSILTAFACVFFVHTPDAVLYIYVMGLMYNAAVKIFNALRRSSVVTIRF